MIRPVIQFKRPDGQDFVLLPTALHQKPSIAAGPIAVGREATRHSLKQFFRNNARKPHHAATLRGRYVGGTFIDLWLAETSRGQLVIGCQKFSRKETAQLRKWALAYRGGAL